MTTLERPVRLESLRVPNESPSESWHFEERRRR